MNQCRLLALVLPLFFAIAGTGALAQGENRDRGSALDPALGARSIEANRGFLPHNRLPASDLPRPEPDQDRSLPGANPQTNAEGEQRLLLAVPNSDPWDLRANTSLEYQTNALLSSIFEEADTVWRSGASLQRNQPIGDTLFLNSRVGWIGYRYDKLGELDFDRIDLDLTLQWIAPNTGRLMLDGWIASLGVGHYRLSDPLDLGDSFFDDTSLALSFLRSIPLAPRHSLVPSLETRWSLAASDEGPRRNEHSGRMFVLSEWSSRISSTVWAGASYYDYSGYHDWNLSAGVSVSLAITEALSTTVSFTSISNDSSIDLLDYDTHNTGVSLAATLRF